VLEDWQPTQAVRPAPGPSRVGPGRAAKRARGRSGRSVHRPPGRSRSAVQAGVAFKRRRSTASCVQQRSRRPRNGQACPKVRSTRECAARSEELKCGGAATLRRAISHAARLKVRIGAAGNFREAELPKPRGAGAGATFRSDGGPKRTAEARWGAAAGPSRLRRAKNSGIKSENNPATRAGLWW
jgi:hypothetical protein